MGEDLIRMEHINKFYGRVQALDDVNFNVARHEIVGLSGRQRRGQVDADQGALGRGAARPAATSSCAASESTSATPRDAIALGIETIYQDSALVTQLSIARNLFLGREPIKGPRFLNRMDTRLMDEVAGDLLRKVGIGKTIPASTPIASLSGGERQAVAIARAMHFDSDLIILDEPTNNLGVAETQGVLRFVRNARDSGHSCIFIAHNIHHVFQVVDRIVVMRRGRIVADDIDPKRTSVAEVEDVITGELAGIGALTGRLSPPLRGLRRREAKVCHGWAIGLSLRGVAGVSRRRRRAGNTRCRTKKSISVFSWGRRFRPAVSPKETRSSGRASTATNFSSSCAERSRSSAATAVSRRLARTVFSARWR